MEILAHILRWFLSPLLKFEPVTLYRKFYPEKKWYLQTKHLADYMTQKDLAEFRSVKLIEIIKICIWEIRPAKTYLACFVVIVLGLFIKPHFEAGFWVFSLFAIVLILYYLSSFETAPAFSKLLCEYLDERKYLNELIVHLRQPSTYEQFIKAVVDIKGIGETCANGNFNYCNRHLGVHFLPVSNADRSALLILFSVEPCIGHHYDLLKLAL